MPARPVPTVIEPWARSLLRCPVTGGELVDGSGPDGAPRLESPSAGLAYPVRDGVPVLLAREAVPLRQGPRLDADERRVSSRR